MNTVQFQTWILHRLPVYILLFTVYMLYAFAHQQTNFTVDSQRVTSVFCKLGHMRLQFIVKLKLKKKYENVE